MTHEVKSRVGHTLVCAETGKSFIGAADGCTFNYARDSVGNILSEEGVDIHEKRALLDRSKPFGCYLSSDGKHATGWKGNVLGAVTRSTSVRLTRLSFTHGRTIQSVQVRDVHGKMWHGRSNPGIFIMLRAYKG